MPAYAQSKLCNILFSLELTKRLEGTGVTANSVHPGVVHTEITYKNDSYFHNLVFSSIFKMFARDSDDGAQTTIYVSLAEELDGVSGKYFSDCKEASTSALAKHAGMAQKLWLASELDVKLD